MPAAEQRSFLGGETSPTLRPRKDVSKVAQGVKTMRNGWVNRSGAWQNRPGSTYLQDTKDQHDEVHVRRFFFNESQAYAIEVGEKYMRFYQLAEAQAVVGDSEPVEAGKLFLSAEEDDLAAISGAAVTAPRPPLGQSLFLALHRSHDVVEDGPPAIQINGGGPPQGIIHTTRTGIPGQLPGDAWFDGSTTLMVRVLDKSNAGGSETWSLTANLYRINSSGATVDGPHAANETVSEVAIDEDYEFTFDVVWAGTFADDDRLAVQLVWQNDPAVSSGPDHVTNDTQHFVKYQGSVETAVLQSSVTLPVLDAPGWDRNASYVNGDYVTVEEVDHEPQTWKMSSETVSVPPAGSAPISPPSPDHTGRLVLTGPQGGLNTISFVAPAARDNYIQWISDASLPNWTEWPHEPMKLTITIGTVSGLGGGEYIDCTAQLFAFESSGPTSEVAMTARDSTFLGESGSIRLTTADSGTTKTLWLPPPKAGGWSSAVTGSAWRLGLVFGGVFPHPFLGTASITIQCGFAGDGLQSPRVRAAGTKVYQCLVDNTNKDPRDSDNSSFWVEASAEVLPWNIATDYLVGDIVSVPSNSSFSAVYNLSNALPSPTQTGFGLTPADDSSGVLDALGAAVGGTMSVDAAFGTPEQMVFLTEAGVPGWEVWPGTGENVSVSIRFTGTGSTGGVTGMDVTVKIARANANNVWQEEGPDSAAHDIVGGGDGTYVFTCTPPVAGWAGPVLSTDRLAIVITYTPTGGAGTGVADVECNDADSTVTTPVIADGDGLDYYYCTADNVGKDPTDADFLTEFWYRLPENDLGAALLEVPTPFLKADLRQLDFKQSQDVITICHRNYPPHELVRALHDTQTFGRWSCLPIAFKPSGLAPTGVYATDPGSDSGNKKLRYKVTFIDDDTNSESVPGSCTLTRGTNTDPDNTNLTDVANVTTASSQSTTDDLVCIQTGHTLETGDEIHIETARTIDGDRAHQNARELLDGWVGTVTKIDANNFSLDGTGGQLTLHPTADTSLAYPQIQITYGLAYVEFDSFYVPKGDGGRRIEITWTPNPNVGKGRYFIYRWIDGEQKWGLLGSSAEPSFADEGDTDDGVGLPAGSGFSHIKARVDEETPPPDYRNPFRFGNWPRASVYHEQRQFFGGTRDYPLRVWGSRVGDYRNFSRRVDNIKADDSIQFDINSGTSDEITLLESLGDLLCTMFSGIAEAKGGKGTGVITPTDGPGLKTTTYAGAARVPAEIVDDSLLFVQARKSIIREKSTDQLDGGIDGHAGRDMTVFSPHLFDGFTFDQLAKAEIPNSILFARRSDGTMLGMTYLKEQDVWGWHRHDTTNGFFQSCTTVPEVGEDVLYIVAKRLVQGSYKYMVERIDVRAVGRSGTDYRIVSKFLDSMLTYNGTNTDGVTTLTLTHTGSPTWLEDDTGYTLTANGEPVFPGDGTNVGNGYRLVDSAGNEVEVLVTADASMTSQTVSLLTNVGATFQGLPSTTAWVKMVDAISGLGHIEGETVNALADGNVFKGLTVTSGAIPDFSRPYGIIHVGLPIRAELITDNIDRVDATGSLIGHKKRCSYVTLFMEDTRGIKVGLDGIPDDKLASLPKELQDTDPLALITDERNLEIVGNWNEHGRIRIVQDDPLPVSISGMVTHYEPGGMA